MSDLDSQFCMRKKIFSAYPPLELLDFLIIQWTSSTLLFDIGYQEKLHIFAGVYICKILHGGVGGGG